MDYLVAAVRQQLTPARYLRIQHPGKRHFDWVLPGVITVAAMLLFSWSPGPMQVLKEDGIIYVITDLIKMLVGFYIAALAAVATFQKADMDGLPAGDPITLNVKRKGVPVVSKLSRRQFLCYLFGYLSFLSIILYFVGACAPLVATLCREISPDWLFLTVRAIALFLYLMFTAQLVTTTLLGLHFLTDRIHR